MGLGLIDQLVAQPSASAPAKGFLPLQVDADASEIKISGNSGAFGTILADITPVANAANNAVFAGNGGNVTGQNEGSLPADLVYNIVLSQADVQSELQAKITSLTADPSQVLAALTGNQRTDVKLLSSIEITPANSGALANLIDNYLARPDTAASLTEAQRTALLGVVAELKQVAAGDASQPLTPILSPLTKGIFDRLAGLNDNNTIIDKVAKFLQQILRDAAQKPVQTSAAAVLSSSIDIENRASLGEVTLLSFSGIIGGAFKNAQTEKEGEEKNSLDIGSDATEAQIIPVIAAPVFVEQTQKTVSEQAIDISLDGVRNNAVASGGQPQKLLADGADDASDVLGADGKKLHTLITGQVELHAGKKEQNAALENADDALAAGAKNHDGDGVDISAFEALTQNDNFAQLLAQFEHIAGLVKKSEASLASVSDDIGAGLDSPNIASLDGNAVPLNASQSSLLSPTVQVAQNGSAHVGRPVPVEQIHVAIKQAHKDGLDTITIQLAPDDLGKIEVRFDRSAEGVSHIVFTVDKQEAFDQLQRDSRSLERALSDAGVNVDAGGLEFNLRQQHQGHDGNQQAQDFGNSSAPLWRGLDAEAEGAATITRDEKSNDVLSQIYQVSLDNGVNIRV